MPAIVWVSLLLFALSIGVGMAFAIVRGLAAWRAFTGFQSRVDDLLLELERNVAGVEDRLGKADRTSQRLAAARARLEESLATAAVLAAALGEARQLLADARGVLPGK